MPSDPTLRRTYQIEVELDDLIGLRMQTAMQFGAVGVELRQAQSQKKPPREIDRLWAVFREFRDRYECACRAVDAFKSHHMDTYKIEEVRDFMAEPERQRRSQARDRQDQQSTGHDTLKAILSELRAIRDRADVPEPNAIDFVQTRRELNALQDGITLLRG